MRWELCPRQSFSVAPTQGNCQQCASTNGSRLMLPVSNIEYIIFLPTTKSQRQWFFYIWFEAQVGDLIQRAPPPRSSRKLQEDSGKVHTRTSEFNVYLMCCCLVEKMSLVGNKVIEFYFSVGFRCTKEMGKINLL